MASQQPITNIDEKHDISAVEDIGLGTSDEVVIIPFTRAEEKRFLWKMGE